MPGNATAPVALLDWQGDPLRTVQDAVWKLEDREDSTNRLTVTTSLAEADGVRSEQELIFKGRRFIVAEVDRDRDADQAVIKADEAQVELAGIVLLDYEPTSWALEQAVDRVLSDTRWTLGDVQHVRYGRAHFDEISALEALQFLARHQDSRLSFDSLRRRVNITQDAGTQHEYVFTYGRQLTNIKKAEQAPVTTVIWPTGADDMTVASVNGGQEYVEDYGYYTAQGISLADARARFRKEEHWSDSRYEVPENMLRDAQNRLAEEAYPQISYTLTAGATVSVDGVDDFDLGELQLGDRVYVWDQEIEAKLVSEVTVVTTSSDASENVLTLAYVPDSLGAGVEGRYFGDSGSPSDGPGRRWKSGPQPRPSMPILESINDLGTAKVRWNGQDHDGNFHTIPEYFGTIEVVAAPLETDGSVPSPNGDSAFSGIPIVSRGGGISTVAFGAAGEFAVWFYMLGWDGRTRSEFSEPLMVTVEALVNRNEIESDLQDAEGRLDQAIQDARDSLEDFRDEWDANWDPDKLVELADRQDTLESDLETGLQGVHHEAEQLAEAARDNAVNQAAANAQSEYDRLQDIAERALSRAGDNVLEDPSFETDYWPNEWGGQGGYNVYRSSVEARTGDYHLRLDGAGPQDFDFASVDVELGQSFRFGIYWATWHWDNSQAWLVLKDTDTGADLAVSEEMNPSGYWSRLHVMLEIPEGVESITPAIRVDLDDARSTTALYVEDASLREVGAAAEALRAAEQARHEAQQAHELAGDAFDTAANAYDAASSKSTIHWSLSAPSGVGNPGDVWWQYETNNSRRTVIGEWHWEDGVWREADIAETRLPLVDIGTGTYGDLHGDRLTAKTVKAGALSVVPDGRDLAPDLVDYADLWTLSSQVSIASSTAAESGLAFRVAGDASAGTGRAYGPWIPVREGDTIYYKVSLGWYSRTPDGALRIYLMYNGSVTSWTRLQSATSTGTYEGHFTVPRDGTTKMSFAVTVDSPATNGGDWAVRDFDVRVATKGVHITPQGIKSPQVDTAELTASSAFLDNAMVNLIQGRMANFDQALIGGALLKDGAVTANKLAVVPDAEDYAPNPGEHPELWSLVGATLASTPLNPTGVIFRFGQSSTDTMIRGPWRPVTSGKQIRFRARYTWWNGSTTGADIQVRMEWSATPEGDRDDYSNFTTILDGSSGFWVEATVTVPEDVAYGRLYLYQPSTDSSNDAGIWGNIECEPMVGAVLIEDGAVTAQKLYVTEEMTAALAKFLRIEAGELASNIIRAMTIQGSRIEGTDIISSTYTANDANGRRSVRLDGANNYLRGSLHAGVTPGTDIRLDYGTVLVDNADGTTSYHRTAFIDFNTSYSTKTPRIWVHPDTGTLYISPGTNPATPPFRGRVRVGGDLGANRLDANQLLVREVTEGPGPLSTIGGLINSNGRVRLSGRTPDTVSSRDQAVMGDGGAAREVSPTGSYRADIVYGAPSDGGSRRPIVSTHMSNTSHDGGRMVSTTTARRGSAAFETRSRQIYNTASGNASFFIYYHAAWN